LARLAPAPQVPGEHQPRPRLIIRGAGHTADGVRNGCGIKGLRGEAFVDRGLRVPAPGPVLGPQARTRMIIKETTRGTGIERAGDGPWRGAAPFQVRPEVLS